METSTPRTHDEIEYLAARATLLAYRYVLRGGLGAGSPQVELGESEPYPLSVEQAARQLADIAKPARCSATVREGRLSVTCTPMRGDAIRQWYEWVAVGSGDRVPFATKYGPPHRNPVFQLRGESDVLTLPLEALEYWLSSYELSGTSCFIRHAPAELQAQAIDAVVEFDGDIVLWSGLLGGRRKS
jgi:hypothetical protein